MLFVWLLLVTLAFQCSAENEEKSPEKSRQFPFDLIPTQPPPVWLRPKTTEASLLKPLWDFLVPTEPPVLYPPPVLSYGPQRPGINQPPFSAMPFTGHQVRLPGYGPRPVPPQHFPSRPYQRGPIRRQSYRPAGPLLSPTFNRPPASSLAYRPSSYVPSLIPYSGNPAPFPVYNPSGVASESAPRPSYKAPPAPSQQKVQPALKPSDNLSNSKPYVSTYPVYNQPGNQKAAPQPNAQNFPKVVIEENPIYISPSENPNEKSPHKEGSSSNDQHQRSEQGNPMSNEPDSVPHLEYSSNNPLKSNCMHPNANVEVPKTQHSGVSSEQLIDIRSGGSSKAVIQEVEAPDLTKPENA